MRECDAGRHTNAHAHAHVHPLARGGVARKGLPRWPATLGGLCRAADDADDGIGGGRQLLRAPPAAVGHLALAVA